MGQEDTLHELLWVPRDTRSPGVRGTGAAVGQRGPGSPMAPGPVACAGGHTDAAAGSQGRILHGKRCGTRTATELI